MKLVGKGLFGFYCLWQRKDRGMLQPHNLKPESAHSRMMPGNGSSTGTEGATKAITKETAHMALRITHAL